MNATAVPSEMKSVTNNILGKSVSFIQNNGRSFFIGFNYLAGALSMGQKI